MNKKEIPAVSNRFAEQTRFMIWQEQNKLRRQQNESYVMGLVQQQIQIAINKYNNNKGAK